MSAIEDLIRARYCGSEGWLTLDEVSDGPGYGAGRRLDLVSVGCWGSNAMHIIGFEVKRTVADWRRELDQPGKRQTFVDEVSEFVFVAPWKVIDPKEVPEDCGLLSVNDSGELRARVRAKQRKRTPSRDFLTAIFKAALRMVQDTLRSQRSFAEFAGRSVSFDELSRFSMKLSNHYSEREREAHKNHEQARAERQRKTREWADAITDLESLGRELAGKPRWGRGDDAPASTFVPLIRSAIQHVRSLGPKRDLDVANELRRLADRIAPRTVQETA